MAIREVEAARATTQRAHHELMVGWKYVPDDKLDWVPMGKARSARQLMLECLGSYRWMARIIQGADWQAAMPKLEAADYATRESIVALAEACLADLLATAEGLTEAQLAEKRVVPWGEETVGGLLAAAHWHSTYHAGQLNYIQTLLGDTEMHHE